MFRIFSTALLLALSSAFAADPQTGGVVLLSDPLVRYVELVQFTSIREEPLFATVVMRGGVTRQYRKDTVIVQILNPPINPAEIRPETALANIAAAAKAAADYPAYKDQISEVRNRWQNVLNVIKSTGNVRPPAPSAAPAAEAPRTTTLTLSGSPLHEVRLAGVADGVARVVHAEGVTTMQIAELSKEQIDALNMTSNRVKIITEDAIAVEILRGTANTEQFLSFLAQDSGRYPLTAFCLSLKERKWSAAAAISESKAQEIAERCTRISPYGQHSPMIDIVAAVQPRDAAGEASALKLCAKITLPGARALAYRIVAEYACSGDRLGTAMVVNELVDKEYDRLPLADRAKAETKKQFEELSGEALQVMSQRALVHELYAIVLARTGRLKEALEVEIDDAHSRLRANCEILKGLIVAGDPFAERYESRQLEELARAGLEQYQTEIMAAHAGALAKIGKVELALEVLDKAIERAKEMRGQVLDWGEIQLLGEKARIYRSMGNEALASENLRDALGRTEEAQDYHAAIRLQELDADQARDTVRRIRTAWLDEKETRSEGLGKFLSLALAQNNVKDTIGAQETLNVAISRLPLCSRPDLEAPALGMMQARCGDFTGATRTLEGITHPEDRTRVSRTLMLEQAKRGDFKAAFIAAQVDGRSDEKWDEIGAAVTGMLHTIEWFPFRRR